MTQTAERRKPCCYSPALPHLHATQESSYARNCGIVPCAQQRNSLTAISALVTYKQVETRFIAVGAKALSFQVCFPKMTLISSVFWHGN